MRYASIAIGAKKRTLSVLPSPAEHHHPVEQPVRALLWRELRDIRSANHTFRCWPRHATIVESRLRKCVLRSIERASATLVECTSGEKREQCNEGDRSDDPRKRSGRRSSDGHSGQFSRRTRPIFRSCDRSALRDSAPSHSQRICRGSRDAPQFEQNFPEPGVEHDAQTTSICGG